MSNSDNGVIIEVSWDTRSDGDPQRLKWEDDFRYKELWAKVGEFFRDGGAGVVLYMGRTSRPTPFGGTTYTHRVEIISEARADALLARMKQIHTKVAERMDSPA